MADIVNLRQARKRKRRDEKARQAAENRRAHGQLGGREEGHAARAELDAKRLEGHRRDVRDERDLTAASAAPMIRKRSVMLKRHATSVSLEDEFWAELKRMAGAARRFARQLIERIDAARSGDNLSSALRLAVLADLKARALALEALSGS